MQCPRCQSPNVQTCSMAYEQGTSTTTTRGTGTGQSAGYSAQSGYGVAQHNIQTSSTSTTRTPFAQRAAPPNNWIFAPLTLLFLLGGIYGILLIPGTLPPQNWLLLLMLPAAFWLYRLIRSPKYREARARWESSWICAACGNIFVPND
jgi:hypothetical protein